MTAKRTNTVALIIFLLLPFAVTAWAQPGQHRSRPDWTNTDHRRNDEWRHENRWDDDHKKDRHRYDRRRHDSRDHYRRYAHHGKKKKHWRDRVWIPYGHLPPVGYCRVWHADRPAGHQPAPIRCEVIRARHVGPYAVVIDHRGAYYDWYRYRAPRRAYRAEPIVRFRPRIEIRFDAGGAWVIGR